MQCDHCGGPAKPLLIGKFCVRGCDKKEQPQEQPVVYRDLFDDEWPNPPPSEEFDDDVDTDPGFGQITLPLYGAGCPHTARYYATNGNVTGTWCKACGKLMSAP